MIVPEVDASATQKSCNGLGSKANAMQHKLRATVLNKRENCFAIAKFSLNIVRDVLSCYEFE